VLEGGVITTRHLVDGIASRMVVRGEVG